MRNLLVSFCGLLLMCAGGWLVGRGFSIWYAIWLMMLGGMCGGHVASRADLMDYYKRRARLAEVESNGGVDQELE
jgi:hypothetical protein